MEKRSGTFGAALLLVVIVFGVFVSFRGSRAFVGDDRRAIPLTCTGWTNAEAAKAIDALPFAGANDILPGQSAEFRSADYIATDSGVSPQPLGGSGVLRCDHFDLGSADDNQRIQGARLLLSLAGRGPAGGEDIIVVRTSFDGQSWTPRSTILLDGDVSNGRNGGYLNLVIPELRTVADLRRLIVELAPNVVPGLTSSEFRLDGAAVDLSLERTAGQEVLPVLPTACIGWSNADRARAIELVPQAGLGDARIDQVALSERAIDGGLSYDLSATSRDLTCGGFPVMSSTQSRDIVDASLVFSFASDSAPGNEDALTFSYSIDGGQTWTALEALPLSGDVGNRSHNGYWRYPLPESLTRESLANLSVRVSHIPGEEPLPVRVAFDGVQLDLTATRPLRDLPPAFSFLTKQYFLPIEEPSLYIEGGELVDLQLYDAAGRPAGVPYSTTSPALGRVKVNIGSARELRPGNYTVVLKTKHGRKVVEETRTFAWGVVTLNTPKTSYRLGENIPVVAGIVDEAGRTVCDAGLTLTITRPDGSTRILKSADGGLTVSSTCGPKSVTPEPDYLARFPADQSGRYVLRLEAETTSGIQEVSQTVDVGIEASMTVERVGPTRINPTEPYLMHLFVTPKVDYRGRVLDVLPGSFSVYDPNNNGSVEQTGETKTVAWHVEWQAGTEYELTYTFDAPDRSPALFSVGPFGSDIFTESRVWNIASDQLVKTDIPNLAYASVSAAPTDWNANQPSLVTTTKPTFTISETAVVKLWTNGFVAPGNAAPERITSYQVRGPGGTTDGFHWAEETVSKDGRERKHFYLVPTDGFRPGTYAVTVDLAGTEADPALTFEWGTLGIDQSAGPALAGAFSAIDVIGRNADGQPFCDAEYDVIFDPDGQALRFSTTDGTLARQADCQTDSGPGIVGSFGISSAAGTYPVRVTRRDGSSERSADATVTVSEAPRPENEIVEELEAAVESTAAAYAQNDRPVLDIEVRKDALFGFLGVDSTVRQVESLIIVGPDDVPVVVDPGERETKRGRSIINEVEIPSETFHRAGLYRAYVTIVQDGIRTVVEQEFRWGVLAVNLRRATEQPETETEIGMAVLDDRGATLCDADLTLEVRDPRGLRQTFRSGSGIDANPECRDKSVTNDFDYRARYRTGPPGTYELILTARTANGERTVSDAFEVQPDPAFDIERATYSMRIYPLENYPVVIAVTPRQDYRGTVVESLPDELEILDLPAGVDEKVADSRRRLTWNVDWKAGERYELKYTIDYPDVSPAFYLAGPLSIGDFRESRQWQIASDSVTPTGTLGFAETAADDNMQWLTYTSATTFTDQGGSVDTTTNTNDMVHVIVREAPTRNELLAGQLETNGTMHITRMDSSAVWSEELEVSGVTATQACDTTLGACNLGFNAAYESLGGRAIVFYGKAANDGILYYNIWDGTSWAGEASTTFRASSTFDTRFVVAKPEAGAKSNRILVMVSDADNDIYAMIFDGGTPGDLTTITGTSSNTNSKNFDGDWETTTRDAVVFWAEAESAAVNPYRYKVYDHGTDTWDSSGTNPGNAHASTNIGRWVNAAADNRTNRIAVSLAGSASDMRPAIWKSDDSSPGLTFGNEELNQETLLTNATGVAWENYNSGTPFAMWVYSANAANADASAYQTWTAGTGFSNETDMPLAMGDDSVMWKLYGTRNTDELMGVGIEWSDDLCFQRWSGTGWASDCTTTEYSTTLPPDTATAHNEQDAFDFAYKNYSPWSRNWKFFSGTDTASTPTTQLANENVAPTGFDSAAGKFRLRFSVAELSGLSQIDARKKLQYTTGTPDDPATTWTDVDDPAGGGIWRYVDCDGGDTDCNDNQTLAGTTLSGSPAAGWWTQDKDAAAGTNMDQTGETVRELEYSVEANNASGSTTYYFRMYDLDIQYGVLREQDNDGSNDCATAACTYPSIQTAAAGITLSGGCFTDETEGTACTDDGSNEIKVAVNGVLSSAADTTVDGSWTFDTTSTPSSGAILVFFINGEATESEEATTIVKYDGSGGVSNVKLYQSQLVIGADNGSSNTDQTISTADLESTAGNGYENGDDAEEDVLYSVANSDLVVDDDANKTEQLYIMYGDTYQPASGGGADTTTHHLEIDSTAVITADSNVFNVAGDWTNGGTFTAGSSTVNLNGTAADQTVTTNGQAFSALTLNNTATAGSDDVIISGALDVNGTLTITDGDLDVNTNDPNITTAGAVTNGTNGTIDTGSGTWTFDGSGTSDLTDNAATKQNLGAVTVDGTTKTLRLLSSAKMTSVTVGPDDILNLNTSSYDLELTGTGTPLTINGTFTPGTSTVTYTHATSATVTPTTYSGLRTNGAGTYTLGGTVADDFERASLGANWTSRVGTPGIAGSSDFNGSASGDNWAAYTGATFANDQYAEGTISAMSSGHEPQVCVRMNSAGSISTYCIVTDGATLFDIIELSSGGWGGIKASSATYPVVGDRIRIEAEGTALRGYLNGRLVMVGSDDTTTSGYAGLGIYGSGTPTATIEDFAAGSLTTVGTDITVTQGTLALGSATVKVNGGDVAVSGTLTQSSNGVMQVATTGSIGGGTSTFGNLIIGSDSSTQTTTAASNFTAAGIHILQSSGTNEFSASSRTLTLTRFGTPLVIDSSETFTASTSTMIFTGSGATTIPVTTYNNLEIKPGTAGAVHTADSASTMTVGGYLTVGNGSNTGTFNLSTNAASVDVAGDLTISTSATLIGNGSGDIWVGGSYANSGSYTSNSGNFTFDAGTTGKTLSGTLSGSSSFGKVTFAGSGGGWTIQSSLDATDSFDVSTGTVTQGANTTLTVTGTTFTLASGTTWNKTSGTGKLVLDNVTELLFTDATSPLQNLGVVQIGMSPGTTTLNSDMSADSVTIPTGDTLKTKGYEVTTTGAFDCQGTCALDMTSTGGESDGTILDIGGDFTMSSSATLTASTNSKLFMNSTSGSDTNRTLTTGGKAYFDVELKNAGGTNDDITVSGNLDVDGALTLTDGQIRLDTNDPNVTLAGNLSIASATTVTKADNGTSTWTFDGTGTSTWTDSTSGVQDLGLVSINGTTKTINLASSAKATKLTVAGSQTFGLGSSGYTLTLTGSGTAGSRPFVNSGTLNEGTNSTVAFTGTSSSDIFDDTFHHMTLAPASGSPTYTMGEGGAGMTINGTFTVGDGVNAVTADFGVDEIQVVHDMSISANGTVLGNPINDMQISGSWLNNGTYTHNGGSLAFTSTTTETLAGTMTGSSDLGNIAFTGSGGQWTTSANLEATGITMNAGTLAGANNVTVNGAVFGTAGVINRSGGTFEIRSSSNQSFGPSTASTTWTFNDLTLGNSHASSPITYTTQNCSSCVMSIGGVLRVGKSGDASGATTTLTGATTTWTLTGTSADPFILLSSPAGAFTANTSTVNYNGVNGSGNVNIATTNYSSLGCSPGSAEILDVAGSFTVSALLTIGTNCSYTIASSQTTTLSANTGTSLTLNGTLTGTGRLTYQNSATTFPTSGAISGGILRFDMVNGSMTMPPRTDYGAVEAYQNAGGARILTAGTAISQTLTISSHLHVYADSAFNTTFEANTYDPVINVGGDVDFLGSGGGTEVLSVGAGTWTVSGDVNLTDGSYSNATGNTLVMNGTGGKTLTPNNATLYNFTVDPTSSATINISTTNVGVTNNLIVADGDTLNINTTLDMDNTTTCSVNLNSTGTITSPAFAGTFWYGCSATFPSAGTVSNYWFIPNATSTDLTLPGRAFTGSPTTIWFYNAGASNRVVTLGTAGGQTFSATANIRVYANSTGNLTVDASTNSPDFSTITDLDFVENSTGQATLVTGSGTHTYSGNVNLTNGTYTASTNHTLVMTGTSKTLTTAGNSLYNFSVSSGSTTMSGTTTLNNDLTVSGGTLTAPSSGALNVAGDFVNDATFVHNSSTLTLNGTTSTTLDTGCVTVTSCTNEDLYSLVINKTAGAGANDDVTLTSTGVRVANTLTVTAGELVQGALNVQVDTGGSVSVGASGIWTNISTGDLYLGGGFDNAGSVTFSSSNAAQCTDVADDIVIDSTVDNTIRTWSGAGTYVMRNVNVDDMSDGAITITAYTSTLSGDTDWTVGSCGVTFSGTVYQSSNEASAFDCTTSSGGQLDLVVAVNGDVTPDTGTCTASGGTFSFSVTDPGAADVPIALYVANTESEKATTVTLSSAGATNITGLSLILDRVITSQESATALTNSHMNTADNGNSGIRYSVSGGNLTVESGMELHILSGKTFTPGGTVTTTATGTSSGSAGDLHIAGTLTMGTNSLTVGGDYNNAGTFNKTNTQTTTLSATGSGFTITPGTGDFNNLTVSGDGGGNGTYTLSGANLTVDGTLTVNTGDTLTIDTGRTLTNTGATDVNNDGTINGSGTLQFTSASGGPDSDANSTGTYSATVRYNSTGGNIASTTFDARTYAGRVELYQDNTTASNRTVTPATDGTYTIGSHLYLINDDAGQTLTLAGGSASAVFTISGDLDFTGTGASSEIIQSGNDVWSVAGNVDLRNGTYTATSGNELKMTGTGNFYGNAQSFYKFTVDGNGNTVTSLDNATVTNALTIGGAADGNNDTLTLSNAYIYSTSTGSVVFGGSGTDTINGTATLVVRNDSIDTDGSFSGSVYVKYDTYTGAANLNVVARQYANLEIDNFLGEAGETVTLGTAGGQTITVDQSFYLTCGGCEFSGTPNTIDGDAFDPTVNIAGSFISNDPTVGSHTLSMGSGIWTVGGNFDASFVGTLNHNSGTLTMNGTGTLTSNGKTLNNFTTSGSGTVTLASATHTFAGNLNFGSSATLAPGTSTVVMNGTTKTIDGGGKTLYNYTVSGSTTTLQNTDLTVSNTLTISASQTLSINPSRTLTHTGATLTWGNGSSTISGSGTLRFTDASGGPGTGGVISAVTRYDASAGNIASTTFDARTYSGQVELYASSSSLRTITLASGTYTTSGASSHLYVIAAGSGDVQVLADTNNPTVTLAGDLDFTGTGEGFEVIAAGTGTWTVSGNVNFTNGFYGPSVAVLTPDYADTAEEWVFVDSFASCSSSTSYSCIGSGSVRYGITEDSDTCIFSFQDRNQYTDRGWLEYNPTGISDSATILTANLGLNVSAGYSASSIVVTRATQDDLHNASCTSGSGTYAKITGSTYGSAALTSTGNFVHPLGTTGSSDIQSRITGTTNRLSLGLYASSFDVSMGSVSAAVGSRPSLYVGYYSSGSPTLIMNGSSKTLTSAGNALYHLYLSGTITLANETHYIGGNLDMTSGDATPGTSTVHMIGTSATLTAPVASDTLYNLTIDPPSAGTVTLAAGGGDLTASGALTVASGDTLSLGSGRILSHTNATNTALSGTISGSGTLRYPSGAGGPGASGTLSSVVRYDASAGNITSGTVDARTYGGAVEYYDNSGSARTITLPSGTFAYSGTVTLTEAGAGSLLVELNTSDPTSTISGTLTIGAGTTLSANSSNALNVNGNYTNNGTFTDNGGTVTLAGSSQQTLSGTMTGSSDFNNLTVTNASGSDPDTSPSVIFASSASAAGTFTATTADTKLRFNAGSTYTMVNISFNGQATGTRVYLRSSTGGTQWNLTSTGTQTVSNTDVKDSNACGGDTIDATDGTNFDSGNNSCWLIDTISLTISDTDIGFGACLPGSARYATGTDGSGTDSVDAHTISISTNARSGYSLTVTGSTLASAGNTITAIGGSPAASNPGNEQFGLRAIKNSGTGTVSSPFDTSNWAFTPSSTQSVATYSGSHSSYSAAYGLRYICNIAELTEAGSYSTSLTYVLTSTF